MNIRTLIIVFSVWLIFGGNAIAETATEQVDERLIEARALLEAASKNPIRRDYSKAFDLFLVLAKEGNPEAQETIGRMYGVPMGPEIDRCEATYWDDKAARAGRAWSQHLMGWNYWIGNGVIRDDDLAYLWFMTAAKNGRKNAAKDAAILARSDLRSPGRVEALDRKLKSWRPEDQPPANIIRIPNIWGLGLIMAIGGLHPCHFPN